MVVELYRANFAVAETSQNSIHTVGLFMEIESTSKTVNFRLFFSLRVVRNELVKLSFGQLIKFSKKMSY